MRHATNRSQEKHRKLTMAALLATNAASNFGVIMSKQDICRLLIVSKWRS